MLPSLIIRGKKMFYESVGKGLPIVFVHGSMGSRISWDFQRPLSEEYRLVFLDLPGHGGADPLDEEISVKLYAGYVVDFSEVWVLRKWLLWGILWVAQSVFSWLWITLSF